MSGCGSVGSEGGMGSVAQSSALRVGHLDGLKGGGVRTHQREGRRASLLVAVVIPEQGHVTTSVSEGVSNPVILKRAAARVQAFAATLSLANKALHWSRLERWWSTRAVVENGEGRTAVEGAPVTARSLCRPLHPCAVRIAPTRSEMEIA